MKEAMYTKWENPSLNQQLKRLELSLSYQLLFFIHLFDLFVLFLFLRLMILLMLFLSYLNYHCARYSSFPVYFKFNLLT